MNVFATSPDPIVSAQHHCDTRREVPKFARDVATRIMPFTLLYCKKETRYAAA